MAKTETQNFISVSAKFPAFVGYADHYFSAPASLVVRNDGERDETLTVRLKSDSDLFVFYEKQATVPYDSAVELTAEGIFSPVFLSECDTVTPCTAKF